MKLRASINLIQLILVVLLLPCTTALAQVPMQPAILRLNRFAGWGDDGQGMLVTSMAVDRLNYLWVGTEDTGLWANSLSTLDHPQWIHITAGTGLADDTCTALLCDSVGRIWAGTLNHGVSIFNGASWRNYDTLTGPLGEHVFALAENPVDHTIWIGTEAGLTEYNQATGTWSYYTKADGLPSNQISAIGFDKAGNLFAGSQCDGIGISSAASGYHIFRTVSGPLKPARAAGGVGLPSPLINTISISGSGTVYVGTDWGLAQSTDSGVSWNFIRGQEWADVAHGEYPTPVDTLPTARNATLLDDYVTCLCQDQSGNLWVGHRQYGAEVFETSRFQRTGQTGSSGGDYTTCMLQTTAGLLIGAYGSGVSVVAGDPATLALPVVTPDPPLPVPAPPPSDDYIAKLATFISAATSRMKPGDVAYEADDWSTQGNWLRGYGTQYALLCESWDGDKNDLFSDNSISTSSFQGPTGVTGDFLASWVAESESNRRCALYDPLVGHRSIANWNDNGEAYPSTSSGGDLWYTVTIPDGMYQLSTYFLNDDGDSGGNRDRDYLEEIYAHVQEHGSVNIVNPPLAMARVTNFRGGLYKSFAICGPATFDVRIDRNFSINGMISAIFVDRFSALVDPADDSPRPWMHGVGYSRPAVTVAAMKSSKALALWLALDQSFASPTTISLLQPFRLLSCRAAAAVALPNDTTEALRWQAHVWTTADELKFEVLMAKAAQASNQH